MSKEDILQAGIAAVRSGDRERAAALLAQVVKSDPASDEGWYWLGLCFTAPDRREYCFRRALALNPGHAKAKQQLEKLSAPAPLPPPAPPFRENVAPASPPARVEAFTPQSLYPPSTPRVSPFVDVDKPEVPDEVRAAATVVEPLSPIPQQPQPIAIPRKKTNRALILLVLSVATLILCGFAGVFLMRSGGTLTWMPPGLAALLTPVQIPTQVVISTAEAQIASPTPDVPTPIPSPRPTVSYTPIFEQAACAFDTPRGADVSCGYLIVPEDRTGDPSHTIRLAVVVYHSHSSNPAAEPVLFLQGGPGGEAVQLSALAYEILVEPFLDERDFITFDQRGTGLSEPVLECEELTRAYLNDIHGLTPGSTRKLVYSNAFLSCNGLMSVQGVNLNAYTTVASAADVRDLLGALGYSRADLYGASYGTRLALVIMRDYPEIVRSAVLDSVVPVETNLFYEYPDTIEYALNTLFESCAADPECSAAYPQLETAFWEIVAQLNLQPVTVTTSSFQSGTITETVDGSTFMSVILGSLRQPGLIGTAPQSIYRFRNGDYSTLIAAQSSLPFIFEGISPGLYISMMCNEHILATTADELAAINTARQDIREYAWLPFYGTADDLFKTCQSWGAIGPRLGENDAAVTDIPALIITGKYDPATPPMFARQIAARLSRSYYFEFPGQGHTPTAADSSGCAMSTVLAFLANPAMEPDRGCLQEIDDADFIVPYTGTPALPLRTVEANGISVRVPRDWLSSFFGEGVYWRGNSPLDITQVNVFREFIGITELEDLLSLKAYGYGGLDTAPVYAGQRQANGLTWTLYTSTSDGRPVDIAMADYRDRALVLLLFCNQDEHDALYRTVFLPMVDSAQP